MIWALWVIAGCMIVCTWLLIKHVQNNVQAVIAKHKQNDKIINALLDIKRELRSK